MSSKTTTAHLFFFCIGKANNDRFSDLKFLENVLVRAKKSVKLEVMVLKIKKLPKTLRFICYSPAGRPVLGNTVPDVLVLETEGIVFPIRTGLG